MPLLFWISKEVENSGHCGCADKKEVQFIGKLRRARVEYVNAKSSGWGFYVISYLIKQEQLCFAASGVHVFNAS